MPVIYSKSRTLPIDVRFYHGARDTASIYSGIAYVIGRIGVCLYGLSALICELVCIVYREKIVCFAVTHSSEFLVVDNAYVARIFGCGKLVFSARIKRVLKDKTRGLRDELIIKGALYNETFSLSSDSVAVITRMQVGMLYDDRAPRRIFKVDYLKPIACVFVKMIPEKLGALAVVFSCQLCGYLVAARVLSVKKDTVYLIVILEHLDTVRLEHCDGIDLIRADAEYRLAKFRDGIAKP